MKVIEEGTPYVWSKEFQCTGKGNGGKGCGSTLLAEAADLKHTYTSSMGCFETHYVTIECPVCTRWTDIYDSDNRQDVLSPKLLAEVLARPKSIPVHENNL